MALLPHKNSLATHVFLLVATLTAIRPRLLRHSYHAQTMVAMDLSRCGISPTLAPVWATAAPREARATSGSPDKGNRIVLGKAGPNSWDPQSGLLLSRAAQCVVHRVDPVGNKQSAILYKTNPFRPTMVAHICRLSNSQ